MAKTRRQKKAKKTRRCVKWGRSRGRKVCRMFSKAGRDRYRVATRRKKVDPRYIDWYLPGGWRTEREYLDHLDREIREVSQILARNQGRNPRSWR